MLSRLSPKFKLWVGQGDPKLRRRYTAGCEQNVKHAWSETPGDWCCTGDAERKALILGIYSSCDNPESKQFSFTETASKYNQYVCGKLFEQIVAVEPFPKLGESRVYYNVDPQFAAVVVCGLGHPCYGYNPIEIRDEGKEAIRLGVGSAVRALDAITLDKIFVESFGHVETSAEGGILAQWMYQDLKKKEHQKKIAQLGLYDSCDWGAWKIGVTKANAQNLSRELMETPANIMTPLNFAITAVDKLTPHGVNIEIRVKEWCEEHKMEAFLSVSKASFEDPMFLEVYYNGCDPCISPVALVGKGITFDSGGLCLKSTEKMKNMRGDLAGASCVLATIRAIASLKLPINLRGLIPLCENMPGASASRPGDIVRAMNGKTILIGNTDFEGPLILADALSYAQKYKPKFILDVGTLTGEMETLMGNAVSGVWTTNDRLWKSIKAASIHTGDRVYRFPLWDGYRKSIVPAHVHCDLTNLAESRGGIPCTTAAFLRHFVCDFDWIHLDTFGVMMEDGTTPYLRPGMSGRPTRTLIEFLAQAACNYAECTKS